MHSSFIAAALTGLAVVHAALPVPGTTGALGPAEIVEGNPAGVTYTAILPNKNTTSIRGYVAGTSASNGTGVNFNINLYGFPSADLGPFIYHIHDQPVPADGNCTGTKAHLDPYIRGETPPCDNKDPANCQVGDLSGKHGNITSSPFQTTYLDLYLSTVHGPASFFGNRSIVVHSNNATRLTCANFTLIAGNSTITGGTAPSPKSTAYTGGAATKLVNIGAIIAGLMAFVL
ncbi:hypothetical protein MMC07_006682 [Pseudocyphellaria aurata]|nr:hypothetical protein [Pseudocyphellaria aurata]